jgi:tetratricopeptide (TPR) repeat protein
MFTELGHRRGELMAVNNLGLAYQGLGDHRAVSCHRTPARAYADPGDLTSQAEALKDLADAYHADGQLARAIDACAQAVAILTDLQHPDAAKPRAKLTELHHNPPGRGQAPGQANRAPPQPERTRRQVERLDPSPI